MPASQSTVNPLNKGLGPIAHSMAADQIAALGWNLLREDLSLPAAVLYRDRLQHNLQWMQRFIAAYRVKIAPHGKTTMAPKLFDMQLKAGAWGITLATAHQTMVAYAHGVRRVLMANQLVGKQNMQTISRLLEDRDFEFFCLVDSARQIEQLGEFFRGKGQRLQVLLEVGANGGRTGVRDFVQLQAVLDALTRYRKHVALSGVEIFEGVLEDETAIRDLVQRAVDITKKLTAENYFDRDSIVISGAGSFWYDVVADVFTRADFGRPAEIVLRPGCYLTHDMGIYRAAQRQVESRNPIAQQMHSSLLPALQVWAYAQSLPEKERAIVAFGRRDASCDSGFPVPALHFRPGGVAPATAPENWKIVKMMDQHAYLQVAEGDDIQVGDMIGFDISHPCLTFDKWRYLCLLENNYQVVDIMPTFF